MQNATSAVMGLIVGAVLMFGALELRGEAEAQTPAVQASPCQEWYHASAFLTGESPFRTLILEQEGTVSARVEGLQNLLDRCLE